MTKTVKINTDIKVDEITTKKPSDTTLQPSNDPNAKVSTDLEGKDVGTKDTKTDKKKIHLDGPLSKIYAQALNIMFANESLTGGLFPDIVDLSNSTDTSVGSDDVGDPDIYVYATNADSMNQDSIKSINDLTKVSNGNKATEKVVIMESIAFNLNGRISALESFVVGNKLPIKYSRESALSYIKNLLVK